MDLKEHLHGYFKTRRTDLLSKLDGLSEYDVRRPMTSTGTNLLGLVKHVASVEVGYFGEVFGRPFRSTPRASCRGGSTSDTRRRSDSSWCTCSRRPRGTPAMRTSSGSRSTARSACAQAI